MDAAKTPGLKKLISFLFNPWFWFMIWKKIVGIFVPKKIKLYGPAPDAALLSVDGTKKLSLLNDYIKKYSDMPLVINMGSYN